jgi:ATP-dependent Zn protease
MSRSSPAPASVKLDVPEFANTAELDRLLQANGVEVTAKPATSETPWWLTALIYFGPTVLFFGLWVWLMRRAGAAGGGMFRFGRAKPQRYEPTTERVRRHAAPSDRLRADGKPRLPRQNVSERSRRSEIR